MKMMKDFRRVILVFVSVISTLFTYRSIFNGKLLGDPFDSRLQLILHEHWWRWFNGLVEFRDTEFFYPFKTALGYSDVFFTQGILYSLLRFLNLDLANSWTVTTIFLLIIGNLGWVFIARKYLNNFVFQVFLVLTSNLSLSFVLYFTLNPNIVGYSFLPWFYLLYVSVKSENNKDRKQFKVGISIILFLIYALSCWYGAFFIALTLIVKLMIDAWFLKLNKKKIEWSFLSKLNLKLILILLPFQLFLIWLFYYVYISVLNQPFRPVEEMLRNSPRLELLPNGANVNGQYLSGSFFRHLYMIFNLDKENEYTIGIGLSVFVIFLYVILYYLYKEYKFLHDYSLGISIIFSYLIFIEINNFSIHRIFFEYIPGFNSIRNPSRYVILIGFFAIFAIFYFFDQFYSSTKRKINRFLILMFSLIVLLDQYRSPFQGWEKSQLINTDLMAKKEEIIQNCDYFYYDKPGGWWYDQIEAMTFAIQAGVPTVNGYSGAFPPGYPTEPFNSDKPPLKIFEWIETIDKKERGCFIAGSTSIKTLNKGLMSVDLVGFTQLETDGKNNWQWAVSPNPYIFIINYSGKRLQLGFELNPTNCFDKTDIRISDDGKKDLYQGVLTQEGKNFEFELDFKESIVKRLEIITKVDSCKLENDPRSLYFEVKNLYYN